MNCWDWSATMVAAEQLSDLLFQAVEDNDLLVSLLEELNVGRAFACRRRR